MSSSNQTSNVTLNGDKQLQYLLDELPKRIVKKVLRKAVTKGSQPILKTAKSNVSKATGLLKKSLKRKLKTYSNGTVIAIIGADRSVQGVRTSPSGKSSKAVPANYIHLVEKGHGGPHPAAPHPFLEPSFSTEKANSGDIMAATLKDGLESEARSLGNM